MFNMFPYIYVIVYIIYDIIPFYLKPNISIFFTENGGKTHILLFYGIYITIILLHSYQVYEYRYRLYSLYVLPLLYIYSILDKVYREISLWEAVEVSGNSRFTFIST